MSRSATSQTGYPRQIVYNKDTVVAITLHQMAMLNIAHTTWIECQEIQDSLIARIDSAVVADSLYNRDIAGYKTLLAAEDQRVQQRGDLIKVQGQDLKSKDKQIKRLRATKTILGISTGVLGIAAIVLAIL